MEEFLSLIQVGMKEGVWALLFITLYLYQIRESRRILEDTKSREDKLIEFVTVMNTRFAKLAHQFETLSVRYETLSGDISELKIALHLALKKE